MGAEMTKRGRPTLLDKQPGLIELVAELYASGMKQGDILDNLPISDPQTLRNWLKDERVLVLVEEILRDKSIRIRRKIDGELEARVADPKRLRQMPPETLLKIRSELSKDFPDRRDSDAEHTRVVEQLYLMAATNPAAAELIAKLNLDPDDTVTVTAEEIHEDDVEAIDVDAVLAEALAKQEPPPDDDGALEI